MCLKKGLAAQPVAQLANARTPIGRVSRLQLHHPEQVPLQDRAGCAWQALLQLPEVIGHQRIDWVRWDVGGLHSGHPIFSHFDPARVTELRDRAIWVILDRPLAEFASGFLVFDYSCLNVRYVIFVYIHFCHAL